MQHPEARRNELSAGIQEMTMVQFPDLAMAVFAFQYAYNPLYRRFCELTGRTPSTVTGWEEIPCLPIRFFRSHTIKTGEWEAEAVFSSSGTTGQHTSYHHLRYLDWYRTLSRKGFEYFYGPLSDYTLFALLPAYLERSGSSLVFMADDFIRQTGKPESGFFLDDTEALLWQLAITKEARRPFILLGVSFALLELAERFSPDLSGGIVMETGGMKGRRKEITRQELHGILTDGFHLTGIHSEYGMTELLSQGWSKGQGIYRPSPTLRVRCRDITDPFCLRDWGRTGAVNVYDLANLDTVSFIATDDLGKVYPDDSFEILGRLDASDIRGCNLLVDA